MSERRAWLDIALIQCPICGRYYADASWYVAEIGADIDCGTCHASFNTQKNMKDRVMLELNVDEKGKIRGADIAKHV